MARVFTTPFILDRIVKDSVLQDFVGLTGLRWAVRKGSGALRTTEDDEEMTCFL